MTLAVEPSQWLDLPLGTQIRMYLGLPAETDISTEIPEETRLREFEKWMTTFIDSNPVVSDSELINLMEELCWLRLGNLTIRIHDKNQKFDLSRDFRGLLALGAAAMMENELDLAQSVLSRAQQVEPQELAPYANLAKIYFHLQRDEDALNWALSGLAVDANAFGIWETLSLLYQADDAVTCGERLRALAEKHNSWAGMSLAAQMIDPQDKVLRVQMLEEVFESGVRTESFLIEFTAALGAAGQYDKIPALYWRAAPDLQPTANSWRLLAHVAQAHLGMSQYAEAKKHFQMVMDEPSLPTHVTDQVRQLLDECDQEMNKEQSATSN
jgi:tetratricopeptide (TPR) repeat protein